MWELWPIVAIVQEGLCLSIVSIGLYLSDSKLSLSEQGVFGYLWEEGV